MRAPLGPQEHCSQQPGPRATQVSMADEGGACCKRQWTLLSRTQGSNSAACRTGVELGTLRVRESSQGAAGCPPPRTLQKVKMWEQRVAATGRERGARSVGRVWGPSPAALGAAEVLRGLSVLAHRDPRLWLGQGHGPSTLSCSRPLGPSLEGLASSL